MPDELREDRIVEELSVGREGPEIHLDVRFRRRRGKGHHLRRLVLTEDQARDLLQELMNTGLG